MKSGGGVKFKSEFLILVGRIGFALVHEGWDSWVLLLLRLLVLVYGNISDNLGLGLGLCLGRRKEQNNLGIGIGSGIASRAVASSSFLPHEASKLNFLHKNYHNPFE